MALNLPPPGALPSVSLRSSLTGMWTGALEGGEYEKNTGLAELGSGASTLFPSEMKPSCGGVCGYGRTGGGMLNVSRDVGVKYPSLALVVVAVVVMAGVFDVVSSSSSYSTSVCVNAGFVVVVAGCSERGGWTPADLGPS